MGLIGLLVSLSAWSKGAVSVASQPVSCSSPYLSAWPNAQIIMTLEHKLLGCELTSTTY